MDTRADAFERMWSRQDAERARPGEELAALTWLVSQMQGHSTWMDGTCWWSLPHNVLHQYRTATPQEAVLAAHKQYQADVLAYAKRLENERGERTRDINTGEH